MLKLFILFFLPISNGSAAVFHGKKYVEGEILVKYKSNTTPTFQKQSIENKFGSRRLKKLNTHGLSHVQIPKNRKIDEVIADFRDDPDIEYAQPNYIYKISTVPNDTYYSREWGLKNTAQTISNTGLGGPDSPIATNNPGTVGSDMSLETAWDTVTDCRSVVVAVVDSGVNYNHEDIAANMWDGGATYPNHGYDFVDSTNDPMDKNGHGTHVAGTIGAIGNNGIGTTGVCWRANLMAVRAMDATGSGTSASIVQGIDFAVANGAKIINMSLGGTVFDAAENSAIANARTSGVLVIVAAGNEGTNVDDALTPSYPCKYTQDNILCVAALSQNNTLASFSNFGINSVDVGAPGTNIVSTWPGTHSTITDTLTTGWNFSTTTAGGWGYKSLNFGTATNTLSNPTTYNHTSAQYANNTDDRVWKIFNLSGKSSSVLEFYLMIDSEQNNDLFSIKAKSSTGDPTSGVELDSVSGSTSGTRYPASYDISPFISANTSIGFNFNSNVSITSFGVNISAFSIKSLAPNNITYNVISGTSMASPHVAGLAAMIFAYNPNFNYTDVLNSIKNGGIANPSLAGKTVTGKAVNATNALAYINPPIGGAAVKLP